ncbi:hypothetical protein DNU06_10555 [Putridiphycobacter roseus]|uniref:Uncharacterized protein n=1 Tax=Putridiphycobacter roseus TaxID=2219161 RepID=A0A2W1MXZ1_9FLAO|nr:hypothetical protein [Putridiphycobacter roseus]PZE16697.1 hypothetical protein DNU06_10555 [Putridiphycobacter roseus]
MKKLIYGLLFLVTVGIGFASCEKEEVITNSEKLKSEEVPSKEQFFEDDNDYSKLSVKNNVLEFESIEYYNSLLNNPNPWSINYLVEHLQSLNFRSLLNSTQDRDENPIDDDYVLSVLDENQIVKIGEWYIRLNGETEKLYACSDNNTQAYNLVLAENAGSEDVYEFTVDDDVLRLLEDEDYLELWSWGCGERKAKSKESESAIKYTASFNNYDYEMKTKIKYRKFGFYFTLVVWNDHLEELPSQNNQTTLRLRYWFQFDNCSYAVRCGSSESNYSHPWLTHQASSAYGWLRIEKEYKWYSGSTNLKSYYFRVRTRCEDSGVPSGNNLYTTYFTNYVTIQDS